MGGSGGGGSERTVNTVQNSGPPAWAKPYYQELYKRAQAASQGLEDIGAFQGPFIAPESSYLPQSRQQLATLASQLQGLGDPVLSLGQRVSSPDFVTSFNPVIQSAIGASTAPILENYYRGTLPALDARATAAGAYGGTRDEIANVIAAQDLNRTLGDVGAQISLPALLELQKIQLAGPSLLQQGAQLQALPSQLLEGVGQAEQARRDLELQAEAAKFQEQIQAPFRPLFPYSSILSGVDVGSTGVSTQQGSAGPSSILPGIFGGGLGGAASGAAIGTLVGGPVIGTILGGLLGAGAGAFG